MRCNNYFSVVPSEKENAGQIGMYLVTLLPRVNRLTVADDSFCRSIYDSFCRSIYKDEALKIAELAMQRGIYMTAVTSLEKVTKFCSTNSPVGSKVFLELAMAYEASGRTQEAYQVYKTLSTCRMEAVKFQARRLLYGLEAMEFMSKWSFGCESIIGLFSICLRLRAFDLGRGRFQRFQSAKDPKYLYRYHWAWEHCRKFRRSVQHGICRPG